MGGTLSAVSPRAAMAAPPRAERTAEGADASRRPSFSMQGLYEAGVLLAVTVDLEAEAARHALRERGGRAARPDYGPRQPDPLAVGEMEGRGENASHLRDAGRDDEETPIRDGVG